MKLGFTIVPHGQIGFMVPGLMANLQTSEMWTRGRATVDDILAFLLSKQMVLWVAFEPDTKKIVGHIISEVKQYPQQKMLVLQYIAAEPHRMKDVEDVVHATLEAYAKDMGCAGIEAFGRPGWGRHLNKRGYAVRTCVYEKYFVGEQP